MNKIEKEAINRLMMIKSEAMDDIYFIVNRVEGHIYAFRYIGEALEYLCRTEVCNQIIDVKALEDKLFYTDSLLSIQCSTLEKKKYTFNFILGSQQILATKKRNSMSLNSYLQKRNQERPLGSMLILKGRL